MNDFPSSGRFKVLAKPSCSESKIIGWDEENKAWRVEIGAPADDNKANIELIKFLSKSFKKQVRIVSGLSSRVKFLEFL